MFDRERGIAGAAFALSRRYFWSITVLSHRIKTVRFVSSCISQCAKMPTRQHLSARNGNDHVDKCFVYIDLRKKIVAKTASGFYGSVPADWCRHHSVNLGPKAFWRIGLR